MRTIFHPVDAVLFDCDGVLLDSMPLWHAMERQLAERAGIDLDPTLAAVLNACTLPQATQLFHERYGVGSSSTALLDEYFASLRNAYKTHVRAKPGALDAIRDLHERGVKMAVVSSGPLAFLEAGLARAGMIHHFQFLGSAEADCQSKRDPRYLADCAARLGGSAAGTWMVDDSTYALAAARHAGIHTVGAYDSDLAGTLQELDEVADLTVKSLYELPLEPVGERMIFL